MTPGGITSKKWITSNKPALTAKRLHNLHARLCVFRHLKKKVRLTPIYQKDYLFFFGSYIAPAATCVIVMRTFVGKNFS